MKCWIFEDDCGSGIGPPVRGLGRGESRKVSGAVRFVVELDERAESVFLRLRRSADALSENHNVQAHPPARCPDRSRRAIHPVDPDGN
jgi:hypothetical protein